MLASLIFILFKKIYDLKIGTAFHFVFSKLPISSENLLKVLGDSLNCILVKHMDFEGKMIACTS